MALSRRGILSYCAAGVALRLVGCVFNYYYIKVFMNIYRIEENWFQAAQTFFMIWNTVNDPLFAYIQDKKSLRITKTRREGILYSGPVLVLAFLVPWIPWGHGSWVTGVHLMVTLFLWDAGYTFMGLAMSALFTELSQDIDDRVSLTRFYQTACIIGTPSVLLLEFTSDSLKNFEQFQVTTVCIAILSGLLFLYSGKNAHTTQDSFKENALHIKNNGDDSNDSATSESYFTQLCQILSNRNFKAFAITSVFHGFHKKFLDSFILIVCDQLVPDSDVPRNARKTFYGGIPLISAIIVVLGASFVSRFSYYSVIKYIYVYIVLAGIAMFFIGPGHPWCLMLFLLLDSCASAVTFTFFIIAQAEIADDLKIEHKLKKPLSSMVFGTNAMISKPSVSLSNMFAVAVLNSYGYSSHTNVTPASPELKHVMFLLVCGYPIIIGTIQFIAWSFYNMPDRTKVENS